MTEPMAHPAPARALVLLAPCALALAVSACSVLGGQRAPSTVYAPEPAAQADPAWPRADWQLAVAAPDASRLLDGTRIAVRPTPGELQVYKGASWAKSPPEQIQDAVLHLLEDSGKLRAARLGSGIAADCTLQGDLRRYEAVYAGGAVPSATIELHARLLSAERQVIASRTFQQAVPASTVATSDVADAFGQALGRLATEVAGWTLAAGNPACHPVPPAH